MSKNFDSPIETGFCGATPVEPKAQVESASVEPAPIPTIKIQLECEGCTAFIESGPLCDKCAVELASHYRVEPAPKEGEKCRPHQEGCICYRCEDWDEAHEPAKVEAGDGLHTRKVAIVTNEAGHKEVKRLVDELKASLLREKELRERSRELRDEIRTLKKLLREVNQFLPERYYRHLKGRIKAAVTGE